jgi:ABC-type uncharacterized transport system permease subunit
MDRPRRHSAWQNKGLGMSEIEELHRRITAAMDRIGQGLDGLSGASAPADTGIDTGADADALAALQQALDEEKLANAQLKERVAALRKQLDNTETNAAQHFQEQGTRSAALDGELTRLRKANEQLRNSNAALREANEAGVGEPHLINKAMLAELQALRAARAADAAEAQAIMGTLAPLIEAAAQDQEESI